MSTLTVLVAPEGSAQGVVSVLTDLSAAGLVDPFMWVVNPSATEPISLLNRVEYGRTTDATLQEVIAGVRVDLLRVCILVPLVSGAAPLSIEQERQTTDTLVASIRPMRTIRLRILLARPGTAIPRGVRVAVDGWHNVVVAPEDGRGPGMGSVRLGSEVTTAELGRHAAPVLAGVVGLWTGLAHAPIDQATVVPGEVIRLARSFYRKLETGQAEGQLRAHLLAQDGTLPLPNDERSPVVPVNDVAGATTAMAAAFWRKHAGVLRSGRRSVDKGTAREQVGAWEALKRFFAFMWAALKNAPGLWYQAMVDSVSTGIAGTINRTVFGGVDSAYEVVFNGRTARGHAAGWLEIGDASDQLSGVIATSSQPYRHSAREDLSGVWQDYARAAMTLADGGTRGNELPPVQIGVNRGVVQRAASVVPGPAERFSNIPGVIRASVETDGVDPTDTLGIDALRLSLREVERDKPEHALPARETLNALHTWKDVHSESFGVAIGRRIGDEFNRTFAEVQDLLRKLATPVDAPPEPDDKNKWLARWVQITTILMLIATGVAVWLVVDARVKWYWALTTLIAIYLISFLAVFRAYYTAQKELFHLLNKRQSVLNARAVDEDNLRAALRDLYRLAQAYGDFLAWSRAIGAFLAAPLGPDVQQQRTALELAWGLPLSTSVGYAAPAGDELGKTVGYLRRDLFNLGWLSSAWEHLVLDAVPLPVGNQPIRVDDSPLWTQPGRGSGSDLDRWSADLFSGARTSTGADVTWRKALERLTGAMSQLTDSFVNRVQRPGGAVVPANEFYSQIDSPAPAEPTDEFDPGLLTDFAVMRAAARVAEDHRKLVHTGIGTICVATQFSDSMPVDFLSGADGGNPDAPYTGPQPDGPAGPDYAPPTLGEGFKF